MGLTTGILVYLLCWWMVWFMVLPFGMKTQGEEGKVVPGTPESAPVKPRILLKMATTTVISALVWGVIYYLISTA